MGLTAEPDAITVGLPPPTAGSLEHPPGGGLGAMPAGPGGIDSLSTDAEEDGAGSSSGEVGSGEGEEAVPARHVLVVACDGVWDLVSNSEATDIALRCGRGWHGSARGCLVLALLPRSTAPPAAPPALPPVCQCSACRCTTGIPLAAFLPVPLARRYESAEAAAHALADTARRRWAAAHSGAFVDDITVAVCFIA